MSEHITSRLERGKATPYAAFLALSMSLTGCYSYEADITEQDRPPMPSQQFPEQPTPSDPTQEAPSPTVAAEPKPSEAPATTPAPQETTSPAATPSEAAPTETPMPEQTEEPAATPTPQETAPPVTTPVETPAITPTPEHSQAPTDRQAAIDCLVERCVALTFDDGPGPHTERLLSHLDEHDAKATFFLIGSQVESHPEIAASIAENHHQLGSHSWDHDDLASKPLDAVAEDVQSTNHIIEATTGIEPEIMRAPYGSTNHNIVAAAQMPEILWSVDPEDWKYRDSNLVADHVIDNTDRGDVVLLHDIHESSVQAVPEILDALTTDGYELVTIDTLFGGTPPDGIYSQQEIQP